MNTMFDVLVLGGGVVGLTGALAMAQRGYQVAIIDASDFHYDLSSIDRRVYAINQASQTLFQQLGVFSSLEKGRIAPYQYMKVWDGVGKASIQFDAREIGAAQLGFIVEESVLKKALLQEIQNYPQIHLVPQQKIETIHNSEKRIVLKNQQDFWEGSLLMIADGAHSSAREKLAVDCYSWSYHQHALVATVHTEKSHQQTAYQVFHPDGPLAFLPLSNPQNSSIVWSVDLKRAQQLMELNDTEFTAQLTQAFGNQLGQITLSSPRHQFPLHMRHVKQYVGPNWLLVGDAAHTIHPLAGLGLNVGLADISTWLNYLDLGSKTLNSNKTLQAYQRHRKHAVWQVILLMEGLKRLFSHTSPPFVSLRNQGLNWCNQSSVVKRLFIQHASG